VLVILSHTGQAKLFSGVYGMASRLPWAYQCNPVSAAGRASPKRGRVFRIFVVDDSAQARRALKSALEQRSEWVVVGEAYNGRHALATFLDHAPHLTLMDFLMPEMNGLETARHLIGRHPDALVLMITTDPSRQLEKEARKAGLRGVCDKSQLSALRSAIEAVMDGRTYFSEDAVA
jgi:DNA-binding NarL/FixJ family response regulator